MCSVRVYYFTGEDSSTVQFEMVHLHKATSDAQLIALTNKRNEQNPSLPYYDCYLNLCDGSIGEDRAGVDVVQALERCVCMES